MNKDLYYKVKLYTKKSSSIYYILKTSFNNTSNVCAVYKHNGKYLGTYSKRNIFPLKEEKLKTSNKKETFDTFLKNFSEDRIFNVLVKNVLRIQYVPLKEAKEYIKSCVSIYNNEISDFTITCSILGATVKELQFKNLVPLEE